MRRTYRTRFKKEILAEFLPPLRPSNKVMILCDGLPSVPAKAALVDFWSRRGYWTFHFRYRGSWESGGMFLAKSPAKDISDIIDELPKGFFEFWSGKKFRIPRPQVYLLGTSFGGCSAILASADPRVKKAVAISPVSDWRVESKIEPLDFLAAFVATAFGTVYRIKRRDWDKLKGGRFFNPATAKGLDGRKLMMIHAKDDIVVPFAPTLALAEKIGARLVLVKRGGHFRLSALSKPPFLNKVVRFLKK